jgi:hypothetical protein
MMLCKQVIATTIALAVFLVSFHVAVEHAGTELYSSPVATDANLPHSHGAGDPADEHSSTTHDHFGVLLKLNGKPFGNPFPVFTTALLRSTHLQPTLELSLPGSLLQRVDPAAPPLFLRHLSLRL